MKISKLHYIKMCQTSLINKWKIDIDYGLWSLRGCGTVGTPSSSSGNLSGKMMFFLNAKENIFYEPSHLISLFLPSFSHPYPCYLRSSSPTQTHYFKKQASNFILPFSLALCYASCLTHIFLYYNQIFLICIMHRLYSLSVHLSLPVVPQLFPSDNFHNINTSTSILLFPPLFAKTFFSVSTVYIFSPYFLTH